MDKLFVNKIRHEIKVKKTTPENDKKKKNRKKVHIDNNEYKSENVFEAESLSKCKLRKQTPYNPRKRPNSTDVHLNKLSKLKKLSFKDDEEVINTPVVKKNGIKKKKHKPTPYKPKISTNSSQNNSLKTILFEFNESSCSENGEGENSVEATPFKPKKETISTDLWLKEENVSFDDAEIDNKSFENQIPVNGKKKTRKATPYRPKKLTKSSEKSFKKEKLSFTDPSEHSFENLFHSSDIKDEDDSVEEFNEFINSFETSLKPEKLSFNDETEHSFENLIHSSDIKDEYDSSCLENSIINDSCIIKKENITVLTNSICSDEETEESIKESSVEKVEETTPNESIVEKKNPKIRYHLFENCKVLEIEKNTTISVHGLMRFRVLDGEIHILGHTIERSDKKYNFYSPKGGALLTISTTTKRTILNCDTLYENRINFVENLIPQQLFPISEPNNQPRTVFEPTNFNVQQYDEENWSKIIDGLNVESKLMIVGGKGTGKSTFLRYTINKLLNKYDKVWIIDLDPGQSEFTIPGCISIVRIDQPIFGPNYTHLLRTEKSILVDINLNDPQHYLQAVKLLIKNVHQESGPLIVNTMGYNHGLGINLISTAIFYIKPTEIVEIRSHFSKKNFQNDFKWKSLKQHAELFETDVKNQHVSYKLHQIVSKSDYLEGWEMSAREKREICVLMYFGQLMHDVVMSLSHWDLPMFEIQLSDIKIVNLYGEEIPIAAINANFVSLCSIEEGTKHFNVHGFGLVRGVDNVEEKLVLITPETAVTLEKVQFLVLTNVRLPASVYMSPDDGFSGPVPYVMEAELFSLGLFTKRSYIPANKTM